MDHEAALINAFVLPAKRARFLDLLASKRGRNKFLENLDHFRDLDPRYLIDIAPADQRAERIFSLLAERGAPSQCHVISSNRSLDGLDVPLANALAKIVGFGEGTLVSCTPGRLGYFEGESQGDRFILERIVP